MLELLGEANSTALIGLIGGLVLGVAARVGRFCTLGAIEDILYGSDDRRNNDGCRTRICRKSFAD